MVKVNKFTIPSSNGENKLHCVLWIPDSKVVATLQLSHGMMEYVERYDEFAKELAEQGVAVIGHDHLGHGYTAENKEGLGYFAQKRGNLYVIKDLHRVATVIQRRYENIPHFILGHSMGSFFVRKYLMIYGDHVDGAVLMGTGFQPAFMVAAGRVMATLVGFLKGKNYRSPFIHHMVLGNYNNTFKPVTTVNDWLSRDKQKVQQYTKDPLCNFLFTCSAYNDLFSIILSLYNKKRLLRIPKQLPVILLSGSEDPVGGCSKGVRGLYRQFKKLGLENVSIKLYKKGRHELLNEIDREIVYQDISQWIRLHI